MSPLPIPQPRISSKHWRITATLSGVLVSALCHAEIQFQDATTAVGISYTGESYGSAWGDLNSDGWPDIFVSNHRFPPALYVNLGDGKFANRGGNVPAFQLRPRADQHGASFSDWDNDGDTDLFVSTGARDSSQFLVNEGGVLVDRTSTFTFDKKSFGGRLPVWFDFTQDGKLDFALLVQGSKPLLFQQTATDFVAANFAFGNNCPDTDFTQLADVTRDSALDLICITQAPYPGKVYDITQKPFVDRTSLFPSGISNSTDSVFMDLDGDAVADGFALRGIETVSGAEIVSSQVIEAHLINHNQKQKSVSFKTAGDVEFEIHWNARNAANIFIGAAGIHPASPPTDAPFLFTLSPSNPDVQGLKSVTSNPGKESIFIGFDPATQTWQFWNVASTWNYTYVYMRSTQPVSSLQVTGLQGGLDLPRPPVFVGSASGAYTVRTNEVGLNKPLSCDSIAAEDFDNDMDVDLYFVCRNAVSNAPDRLFENRNGNFVEVANGGGAVGPVGPGQGLGENVSIGDFDVDGRVDMLVTNGLALFPEKNFTNGGPTKFFRNVSNPGNHWIELDLVGTTSNRDAVGARVIATAGGVSQLREQGGTYRRWTQNHKRLHFGLGPNATVNLEVTWPSGLFQTFNNVAADRLYTVTEGGQIEVRTPGTVPPPPLPACGLPTYNAGTEQAVFVGKDCASGVWKFRATPGGQKLTYRGAMTSSEPFTNVAGFGLESFDQVNWTPGTGLVDYSLTVQNAAQDGIDLTFPDSASVCIGVSAPAGVAVFLGPSRIAVGVPFDPKTGESCTQ